MDKYVAGIEAQNDSLREKLAEAEEKIDELQKKLEEYTTPVIGYKGTNSYTTGAITTWDSLSIDTSSYTQLPNPTIQLGEETITEADIKKLKKLIDEQDKEETE